MNFKYSLPNYLVDKISRMEDFANGATQVTIRLKSGATFHRVVVSNSSYIVAILGCDDLPFSIDDIADAYQCEDDKNPAERGGWKFWDNWRRAT